MPPVLKSLYLRVPTGALRKTVSSFSQGLSYTVDISTSLVNGRFLRTLSNFSPR